MEHLFPQQAACAPRCRRLSEMHTPIGLLIDIWGASQSMSVSIHERVDVRPSVVGDRKNNFDEGHLSGFDSRSFQSACNSTFLSSLGKVWPRKISAPLLNFSSPNFFVTDSRAPSGRRMHDIISFIFSSFVPAISFSSKAERPEQSRLLWLHSTRSARDR